MRSVQRRSNGRDLMGSLSRWSVQMNRLLLSKSFAYFYIFIIVINIAVIIWTVSEKYPTHPLYIIMDVFITLSLTFEVFVRYVATREDFWKTKSNIVDVATCILCLLSLLLYIAGPSSFEENSDIISLMILILRNFIQSLRLFFLYKHEAAKFSVNKLPVDLSKADPQFYDDDTAFLLKSEDAPSRARTKSPAVLSSVHVDTVQSPALPVRSGDDDELLDTL
eukprot:GCRY01002339.1.p1 GENE.GCRY01002339.1~~GCRY01002339.1.p1  ORF type:complete len:222 (+),score=14.11 GCRY01002339.1:234-899(+)